MVNEVQAQRMTEGRGFIAALDQSGGSTPKALAQYGLDESAYSSDSQMFDLIHRMRSRIVMSPAFGGDRVLAAILFEDTMKRDFGGTPAAHYLWDEKGVVPFLKIDAGLAEASGGVQLMKPIPELDDLLESGVEHGIFGTKERSVIGAADGNGIEAVVAQQFELANQVLAHGLVPILEPEVTITIPDKEAAEDFLRGEILRRLDELDDAHRVIVKLSLPTETNFYRPLIEHPRVMRVVALSGGYTRAEADALLAEDDGEIASFSRALTEGLTVQQTDEEFDAALNTAIQAIYEASVGH